MMWSNQSRSKVTMKAVSLAAIFALLVAVVFAAGVAEAKGGGGGGRGGGGGGGKPTSSSSSSSKPFSGASSSSFGNASAKGLPPGVAKPSSPYYNSPKYGTKHHSFSNFFLWAWIFHRGGEDCDGDDVSEGDPDCYYEEEYVEANNDFGGWAVTGVGVVGAVLLVRTLRKRSKEGRGAFGSVAHRGASKDSSTSMDLGTRTNRS